MPAPLSIASLAYDGALIGLPERDAFMADGYAPNGREEDGIFEGVNFRPVSAQELASAGLSPRVIVHDYLYADLRNLFAAGGTGKTTLVLFEATIMALGRPLWGRSLPGARRTTIVTREDRRELLVGRLREIMKAMHLTADEVQQVLEHVCIIDLVIIPFRLSCVIDDMVMPHRVNVDALLEKLIEHCRPDLLVFDPLVSFGVGEARINDAEQGLIESMRIFRHYLGCCVQGVHHTGKANARDKALDQYAGRGGSALSDGARMIAVMQPLDPVEWEQETGTRLAAGEAGIVMALPKLSYCRPQDPIFIRRNGYAFAQEAVSKRSFEQVSAATAEQVFQFIAHELSEGRRHTQNTLQDVRREMNLSRDDVRAAVGRLKAAGRLIPVGTAGKPDYHLATIDGADPARNPARSTSENWPKNGDSK